MRKMESLRKSLPFKKSSRLGRVTPANIFCLAAGGSEPFNREALGSSYQAGWPRTPRPQ